MADAVVTTLGSAQSYAKNDVYAVGEHCYHMDNALTDSGTVGTAITTPGTYNAAAFDASVKKFGTHSMKLVAATNGSFFHIPGSSNLNFSGDFTIDFWIKMDAVMRDSSTYHVILGTDREGDSDSRRQIGLFWYGTGYGSGGGYFGLYGTNATGTEEVSKTLYTGAGLMSDAEIVDWQHMAITRKDGWMDLWWGGKQMAAYNARLVCAGDINVGDFGLTFGRDQWYSPVADNTQTDAQDCTMWIDELRITNGTALWSGTDSFTPPTGVAPQTVTHTYVKNSLGREKRIV